MSKFNVPIAPDQREFLQANKDELSKKDSGKAIWQNRVKMASEAYQIEKAIHLGLSVTSLVPADASDEADQVDSSFPSWPTFRDNFILDWIHSRVVVTEEEADTMFDRTAEEALAAIDQAERDGAGDTSTTDGATDTTAATTTTTPAPTPAPVVTKAKRVRKAVVKAVKAKTAKPKAKKVAAKKKSVGTASAKAQTIIERFKAKGWSRKDILIKLQDQLEMGSAYASTLYQKFA